MNLDEGRTDEALACFDAGAALLRDAVDGATLAQLLCGRARLWWGAGRSEDARRDLAEAEGLAATRGAGADTGLGRELARTRAVVEAP